ncbi:MAG TPA: serine hydrolase domain-containing protein [Gemmatimonadaceae bacterium]|nr:serine hydrolase domain-containing protein [Gemmatimonadaceae bacterium]
MLSITIPSRSICLALSTILVAAPTSHGQSASARLAACAATGRTECALFAAIDSAARQIVASGQSPGLAVGIVRNASLIFNKGYGKSNLELETPVTPSTVFPIFSITKTFTAAAILKMAERGQLNIDDKLTRFFPDFPRGNEVTLRNLLNHTSGIHDFAAPDFPLNTLGATPEALVDYIAHQQPLYNFDPGTKWEYSNSNYVLLGKIIEKISGKSYRDYMAQNVFEKLGLSNTAVDRNIDVVRERASGYMPDRSSPGHFINGIYQDMSIPYAAGAIRSTVHDLAAWFIALFGGQVVSASSLRQLVTPARVRDGRFAGDVLANNGAPGSWGYYGLGMETYSLAGHCLRGHGGSFPSFNAIAYNYPADGVMIFVFSNTGRVATQMATKIAKVLFGDAVGDANAVPCEVDR